MLTSVGPVQVAVRLSQVPAAVSISRPATHLPAPHLAPRMLRAALL